MLYLRSHSLFLVKFAKDLGDKLESVDAYVHHLQDVQRDRALESALQTQTLDHTASGANRAVLLVQTDGMDQAKWSLPRHGGARQSKKAASVVRKLG